MTDRLVEFISTSLSILPKELIVFVISMLPVLELRGGLVAATLLNIPYVQAVIISILGNIVPIPFIILFIRRILAFLQKHGPIKKFATWVENRGIRKGRELQEKYPKYILLGLFLFVGIPLPVTGAWTGALVAVLLDLSPKKAVPVILGGLVLAAGIMSIFTYFIPWVISSMA